MKKIVVLSILLLSTIILTGCDVNDVSGKRLSCTKTYQERMLEGIGRITIDYNMDEKPIKYYVDADYYVNEEIYESYDNKKEENMKIISESILTELKENYGNYNPTINTAIEGNRFSIEIIIDDQLFLKTLNTIDNEKAAAEADQGQFICSIEYIEK